MGSSASLTARHGLVEVAWNAGKDRTYLAMGTPARYAFR